MKSYSVALPGGSNPMVRPLLRDRILRCGPSSRIESYSVALLTWLGIRDRTFRYCPSQGIGLSAIAPTGGLDFPLWPLPGDQGPYRGIVWIFFQSMQSPLKGQPVKNVSMVEQYYPKTITFMLVSCSSLKKKVDPLRGPHRGIGFEIEFLGEFKFILEIVLK
jgi:hypothetical protein